MDKEGNPLSSNADGSDQKSSQSAADVKPVAAPIPTEANKCEAGSWNPVCVAEQIVGWFLKLIINLLGFVIRALISVLLAFARYNGFADAKPVQIGWSIVRDVCNMFFIVILLISAFSTILQYNSEFHYSKVLPKLLLTAVLINFSKTLIALLIDFSQVVMLTFVNAFSEAGAGNFVSALGLAEYMKQGNGEAVVPTAGQLLIFFMAIIMLLISIGVILVLIMYIVSRIVGLWIALIFSPIALFELAVPGKLQKGMSVFTNKYWSKLSGFLTGGPVVAFLLWLTLAITQQTFAGGNGAGSLGITPDAVTTGAPQGGVSTTQGIATFIIAISMMLLALDTAVDAANEIGSATVKNLAGKVRGFTTGAAAWVAKSPLTGARAAARKTGLASGASRVALSFPGMNRLMPTAVQKALQKEMVRPAVVKEQKMKAQTEGMQYMTVAQQEAAMKASSPEARAKYLQSLGSEKTQKELQAQGAVQEKKQMAARVGRSLTKEEEMAADNVARQNAQEYRADKLDKGKKLAMERRDYETADAIAKQQMANPMLTKDPEARNKALKGLLDDPKKLATLENTKDAEVARRLLTEGNILQLNPAKTNVAGVDSAALKKLLDQKEIKDNKPLADALQAVATHARLSPGMAVADLDKATIQKDQTGRTRLMGTNGNPMQNTALTSTLGTMQTGGTWNDAAQIQTAMQQGGHLNDLKVDAGGTSSATLGSMASSAMKLANTSVATNPAVADAQLKAIKPILDQTDTQSQAVITKIVDQIGDTASEFHELVLGHYDKLVGDAKKAADKALDLLIKNAESSANAKSMLRGMATDVRVKNLPRGIAEKIRGGERT